MISLTPISAASRRARCTSNGAIVQGLVTHGDGTEAVGRRQERDSRRRLSESMTTFTQSTTSPTVAPTTTTAIGV